MKYIALSTIMVNASLSISPRCIAFPGGLSYGGDGVPGVFDDEHIISHLKEADRPAARQYIARAINKGGCCPVGGTPNLVPSSDDGGILIPDAGGQQLVKPTRKRASEEGTVDVSAPQAPPAA